MQINSEKSEYELKTVNSDVGTSLKFNGWAPTDGTSSQPAAGNSLL